MPADAKLLPPESGQGKMKSGQGMMTDTLKPITAETLLSQLMGASEHRMELWANHVPPAERSSFIEKLSSIIHSQPTPLAGAGSPSFILTHPHSP